MTEADLIRMALERGGSVGPSAAETMAQSAAPATPAKDGARGRAHLCPAQMTEKQFQADVIKLAKSLGWLVYHVHFSQRSEKGFPDLVLVRDRVIFAELKAEYGKQTKEQRSWERWLCDAGALFYLWRPSDWNEIVRILTPPR